MRPYSIYKIDCADCGQRHDNHESEGTCPYCGAVYRVEWPASTTATPGGKRRASMRMFEAVAVAKTTGKGKVM